MKSLRIPLLALLLLASVAGLRSQSNPASDDARRASDIRARIAERATAGAATNLHSVAIFMPREDIYNVTRDVTERILAYYKSNPKDIPLAKYPLISDRDILNYDWKTHTLTVDRAAIARIRPPSVRGAPFVLVVDGEPVYVGAFYVSISSASCPVPVILVDHLLVRQSSTLEIQRAYPGDGVPGQSENDPRTDERLKKALQALGKLKE